MSRTEETQPGVVLAKYDNLYECILKSIDFKNFGTVIELTFNNVYDDSGKIRKNLEQESLLVMRFSLVQEFHYNGALSKGLAEDISSLNWGIMEVVSVTFEDDPEFLKPYSDYPVQFRHMTVGWPFERRIDIVFHKLEVIELGKHT